MKRRQFIQTGLAAAALPLIPRWSFAQELGGEFFLQIYMEGGWDTTLATEAWDFTTAPDEKKVFIEYTSEERLAFASGYMPKWDIQARQLLPYRALRMACSPILVASLLKNFMTQIALRF